MAKRFLLLFPCWVFLLQELSGQSKTVLWYKEPAEFFEESLVLGNGKLGATVFGGVKTDKIYLNDATLWSGEPVSPLMNPEAHTQIEAIRKALKNEDYALADQLQKKVQGKFSESYAPLGTLLLRFDTEKYEQYHRSLDLQQATSQTQYEVQGNRFQRDYLVSFPDKVFVIRLKSAKKAKLNFSIAFNSLLKYKVSTAGKVLQARGYAPLVAEPSYRGNIRNPIIFEEGRGTRFTTMVKVKSPDGSVSSTDSSLSVSDATEATVYVTIATSFNGFDKNPATEGIDDRALAQQQLDQAFKKSYGQIQTAHQSDYQRFFKRVALDFGSTTAPDLPTNERLKRYAQGLEDKNLEILYFQYGRYLLISSSRTPNVPANLQGIWNPYIRPPWSSNYTTNINVQENYWLAENTNLSELHKPLLGFIKNLSRNGAITAQSFYGVGGWTLAHNSDIWAMTNPVGDFGQGYPGWANWNMGGAWLATHLWEHYTFTKDLNYLRNEAYPLMKGAAQFCLEWLVADAKGYLITSPATSPENDYLTPKGYKGATLYGATADLAMIRELFQQTIEAERIIGGDAAFAASLQKSLERLYPYQVGRKGNLQEWYYDWEDADPKHRHQTHLFGLYPGHHISPQQTPQLANACKATLEIKGDETTGWSKGWRINLWARLQDGNRAYKMIRELMRYVEPDQAAKTNYSRGGGTYPNLFDAHPPFQIDGNFGGSAAFVEMLLQSSLSQIHLLPALPDAWSEGTAKGLRARGGFEVNMKWQNNQLLNATLYSATGGNTNVMYRDKSVSVKLKAGETKVLSF